MLRPLNPNGVNWAYLCFSEEKQATGFNLGDAEDDVVAAAEVAEEEGCEVESVDLKELTRQCAPNVRQHVWHQRGLDWFSSPTPTLPFSLPRRLLRRRQR
jgi:hypothetical protein